MQLKGQQAEKGTEHADADAEFEKKTSDAPAGRATTEEEEEWEREFEIRPLAVRCLSMTAWRAVD